MWPDRFSPGATNNFGSADPAVVVDGGVPLREQRAPDDRRGGGAKRQRSPGEEERRQAVASFRDGARVPVHCQSTRDNRARCAMSVLTYRVAIKVWTLS
jgi:hypothetical protein